MCIHRHEQVQLALAKGVLKTANLPVQDEAPGLMPSPEGGLREERPEDIFVQSPDACQ